MIKTVEWTKEGVRLLDQRLLPNEEKYVTLYSHEEVAEAIKNMTVRGAPAIGVAAAMGLALGASQSVGTSVADLEFDFEYMCEVMAATRPTAVNLFWAIERMRGVVEKAKAEKVRDVEELKTRLVNEALAIFQDDIDSNRAIGRYGAELIDDDSTVLTHCNAGALATAGDYGTQAYRAGDQADGLSAPRRFRAVIFVLLAVERLHDDLHAEPRRAERPGRGGPAARGAG